MKTIQLEELKVTINQLKRKARRERAKARKQAHKQQMEAYKLAMQAESEHESREHLKMFRDGMPVRSAKKFRNNVSNQHAGTCKPSLVTKRFGCTTIVVKSTNY